MNISEVEKLRFWSKVALPDENGCMLWMAGRYGSGYAAIKIDGAQHKAHRVSLWMAEGAPPSNEHQAAHSCRNRHCVAPSHLRWATPLENQADRHRDGTDNRGERNSRTKLTWPLVREIRARLARGEQRQRLANEYGVGWTQIDRIRTHESWVESPESEVS